MKKNYSFYLFLILTIFQCLDSQAKDLYWINGSGNWHDKTHWSLTSGGEASGIIPSEKDNVFIDNFSFTDPSNNFILVKNNAKIKSLVWNAKKKVSLVSLDSNQKIEVYKNFILNAFFDNKFKGSLVFKGKSTSVIQFNRSKIKGNLIFDKKTGTIKLKGNLLTDKNVNIIHNSGKLLAMSNVIINKGTLISTGNIESSIELGNTTVWHNEKGLRILNKNFELLGSTNKFTLSSEGEKVIDEGNKNNIPLNIGPKVNLLAVCSGNPDITITTAKLPAYSNGFDVTCSDSCNGRAYVTVTGGVGPFTFDWLGYGANGFNDNDTIYNLCKGTNGLSVRDGGQNLPRGLICNETVNITNPIKISIITDSLHIPECANNCDGYIKYDVRFGTPPYTYSWQHDPNNRTTLSSNLCGGSYTINLLDSLGCGASKTIQLNPTINIKFNIGKKDKNCTSNCNGEAFVSNISGGISGINYSTVWNNNSNNDTIKNLCSGKYKIEVFQAPNCKFTDSVDIVTKFPAPFVSVNVVNSRCQGFCDGSANIIANGASTQITHSISNGSVIIGDTASLTNLCSGTYYDTLKYGNGSCDTIISFTLINRTQINQLLRSQAVSCAYRCNGRAVIIPTGGTSPYTIQVDNNTPTTNNLISNLCKGQRALKITDVNGCVSTDTFTINGPDSITFNKSVTSISCTNNCSGRISYSNILGGRRPYSIRWTNSNSRLTTRNNLCQGTYIFTISHFNNCSYSDTTVLTLPPPFSVSLISANPCAGENNGSITARIVGGKAPFRFSWTPTNDTTQNLSNLVAGKYVLTITDANNCQAKDSVTLIEKSVGFAISLDSINPCLNGNNGSINTNVSSGVMPYKFSWTPTNDTTQNLSNLRAGKYVVTITDSNNCQKKDSVTLIETPINLTINFDSINPCPSGNNGSITTTTVSGGVMPYKFSWTPTNDTTQNLSNLVAGKYVLTITDSNNCQDKDSVTLIETPINLTINFDSVNPCPSGNNGSITTTAISGGVMPYKFSWTPTNDTTQNLSNLVAGKYVLTITDSNNCQDKDSVTLIETPINLTINFDSVNPCPSGNNGSITTTAVSGGVMPYKFSWTPTNDTTQNLSNLRAGKYVVTITDSNNCQDKDSVILIETPINLTINFDSVNPCLGGNNGSITTTVSGGIMPYKFSWTPTNDTTQNLSNLRAGKYVVTITDSNNCQDKDSITLENQKSITAVEQITPSSCLTCNGAILVQPSGGTAPYRHSWSNKQTTARISGLCPDSVYYDTIYDNNNCFNIFSYKMTKKNAPVVSKVNIRDTICYNSCDGFISLNILGNATPFNYSWTPNQPGSTDSIFGLCQGTYNLALSDTNGCRLDTSFNIYRSRDTIKITSAVKEANCRGIICDGEANITVTGNTNPYSIKWSDNNSNRFSRNDLCEGNYTIIVNDSRGCIDSQQVKIDKKSSCLSVKIDSIKQISCFGTCDGFIDINPINGMAPFTIIWNNNPSRNTDTINNLCAGTYSLKITDNLGETFDTNFIITQPKEITANLSLTQSSCGVCNGSALANISGGKLPYTFKWGNNAPIRINSINNLCAGIDSVIITDSNNCSKIFQYNINSINGPIFTINKKDIDCDSTCNGSAKLNLTSTTPITKISWMPVNIIGLQDSISGLCEQSYTVSVEDANKCITNQSFTIKNSNILINPIVVNPSCNNSCDGQINLNPSNNNYFYRWNNKNLQSSSRTSLCAGVYQISVANSQGCQLDTTLNLLNPDTIKIAFNSTQSTCLNPCSGGITSMVSGGTPPYKYLWSNGDTTSSINNLCVGKYALTITDFNGCSKTDSINVLVDLTNIFSPMFTQIAPSSCGGSDGQIIITNIVNANPPIVYQWNDPNNQTTDTAKNLKAGLYNVRITTGQGCIDSFDVILKDTGNISIQFITDTINCSGKCTGRIIGRTLGGTPPYSYQWNDPNNQTTDTANGLCAGVYLLTIKDSKGCIGVDSVRLYERSPLMLEFKETPISCFNKKDGMLEVNAKGGNGIYSYKWFTRPFSFKKKIDTLSSGRYIVEVTDGNNCVVNDTFELKSPEKLKLNIFEIAPSCNNVCDAEVYVMVSGGKYPYSFAWGHDPLKTDSTLKQACADSTYKVVVIDANQCSDFISLKVSNSKLLSIDIKNIKPTSCTSTCDGEVLINISGGVKPYKYKWNTTSETTNNPKNLCFGKNILSITDFRNCTKDFQVDIPSQDSLIVNAGKDSVICLGTTDTFTLTSSILKKYDTLKWYSVDTGFIDTTKNITFNPKNTGVFCFYLEAKNSTCTSIDTVCINVSKPVISASKNKTIFKGDTTQVAVSISNSSYKSILWTPLESIQDNSVASTMVYPNQTTSYIVKVTDNFNCESIDSVLITVLNKIIPPDAITPNNDGVNDVWKIRGLEKYPDNKVTIFTQWGEIIYQTKSYQNNWDGKNNKGKNLPVGTYYYILDINSEEIKEPITGPITIVK